MSPRKSRGNATKKQGTDHRSRRKTIPASEVGFTLTVSEEARRKIDRIEEEAIKAAQEDQKFAFR